MELTEMTVEACREFLGKHTLGHLACIGEKYPYVVPVHYAYETRRIFIFSMPGLKTDYLRKRPYAGLQVEELQTDRNWTSVLVQGRCEELPDTPERHNERIHAWSLLEKRPFWWEPGSFELTSGGDLEDGIPLFSVLRLKWCQDDRWRDVSIDECDFYASIVQVFLFWRFLLVVPPLIPR